jgi:serine O-acetyltransferase
VNSGGISREERRRLDDIIRDHARLRPPFFVALREDARRYLAHGATTQEPTPGALAILRLLWTSHDYMGVALYRLRTALIDRGIPVLPWLLNRVCVGFFNMEISDALVIREGLYIPHGNVVVVGIALIGRNATLYPWAGIGCLQGSFIGPTIGDNVRIGTHTNILGAMTIGDGATIGSGSVVTGDVPPGMTVAGVPARPVAPEEALLTG